jgi:hypothetical protein
MTTLLFALYPERRIALAVVNLSHSGRNISLKEEAGEWDIQRAWTYGLSTAAPRSCPARSSARAAFASPRGNAVVSVRIFA